MAFKNSDDSEGQFSKKKLFNVMFKKMGWKKTKNKFYSFKRTLIQHIKIKSISTWGNGNKPQIEQFKILNFTHETVPKKIWYRAQNRRTESKTIFLFLFCQRIFQYKVLLKIDKEHKTEEQKAKQYFCFYSAKDFFKTRFF
jgi:hypothetical protein